MWSVLNTAFGCGDISHCYLTAQNTADDCAQALAAVIIIQIQEITKEDILSVPTLTNDYSR